MVAHHGVDYAYDLQAIISFCRPHDRALGFNQAILEAVKHGDAVTLETLFKTYDVDFEWDISKDYVYRKAAELKADACLEVMKRYNY